MPMNIININNGLKFEVPDSWMKPLITFLELVKEKTENNQNKEAVLRVRKDLEKHGAKVTLLVCEDCGSKKLFKGSLCEDCWYKKEMERI